MFTSSSPNMMLSPLNDQKRDVLPLLHADNEDQQSLMETSQLSIRSPSSLFNDIHHNNSSTTTSSHRKSPRYKTNWTFDTLCAHPYSPLASINLESVFNVSNFQLLSQEKRDELYSMLPEADQCAFFHTHQPYHSPAPPPPPPPQVPSHQPQHYSQHPYDSYHGSPFHLYHQHQPQPACTSTNHIFSSPSPAPQLSTNFFSKTENPIFWNHLTDWQTMLSQGDFVDQPSSPSLQSPSPPTTVKHSIASHKSSNSTISSSYYSASASAAAVSSSPTAANQNDRSRHYRKSKSRPSTTMMTRPTSGRKGDSVSKGEHFEAYWASKMASNESSGHQTDTLAVNTSTAHTSSNEREKTHNVAGESKCITLKDMCRKGLIRVRDVIVYKRNFSASKVIVSKSMTVIKACGTSGISIELDGEFYEDFETPTALETKILDHHGEVTKDKRPNGNAFKSIRLIRDGKDLGRLFDIRKDGFGGSEQ